jgi:transposase
MIERENCDQTSTKRFFDQLRTEEAYKDMNIPIHLFLDNERYQKCYTVQEYAKTKNIILEYLPAYSPNLNLIERFWKFTKKVLVRNQYYETFDEFKQAFELFFLSLDQYKSSLETLLTLKFEIIGNY